MLDNGKITIFILLVFSIAHVRESIAERNKNIHVNINDEESEKDKLDDSLEHWKGRWMPSRPGEYKPPPKIFHKTNKTIELSQKNDEDLEHWEGKWMPSRPGEYTPPPKIFHQKNKTIELSEKNYEDSLKHWNGRWLPSRPGEYKPPPKIFHKNHNNKTEKSLSGQRYINTGIHYLCDDGLNNLEIDWDHSSANYVCFGTKILPNISIVAEYYCETIPKNYKVMHQCMFETINYGQDIPTFGTSRPVWPVYGEYKYIPVQRWLHSLERGAIVMLYHPCANTLEVNRLKSLIKRCLKRHIISPNNYLDEERPLALLAWGCKLSMSYVDENIVEQFISENALRGPEEEDFKDGIYTDGLMEKAKLVSGEKDEHLCP